MNREKEFQNMKAKLIKPYYKSLKDLKEVFICGSFFSSELDNEFVKILQGHGIKVKGFVAVPYINITPMPNIEIYDIRQFHKRKETIVYIGGFKYIQDMAAEKRVNTAEIHKFMTQYKDYAQKGNILVIPLHILIQYFDIELFWFNNFFKEYYNNISEYENLHNLFSDAISLKVLKGIIEYRKTYDIKPLSAITAPHEQLYFEKFIFKYPQKDIFVDGGGNDGSTTAEYIRKNKDYKHIYFFEPNNIIMQTAKKQLKNYSNINYYECGLSDKQKKDNIFIINGNNKASFLCEKNNLTKKCNMVRLDDIISVPCFLKFDIEGSELNALEGSKKLIEKNSLLAICVYHKPSHIWEIPKKIYKINSKYKFYLRNYCHNLEETVLYGLPENG